MVADQGVVGGRCDLERVSSQVAHLFLIVRLAGLQKVLNVLQLASLELDRVFLLPVLLQEGHLEFLLNLSGLEGVDQRRAKPCLAGEFVLVQRGMHLSHGWLVMRRLSKEVGTIECLRPGRGLVNMKHFALHLARRLALQVSSKLLSALDSFLYLGCALSSGDKLDNLAACGLRREEEAAALLFKLLILQAHLDQVSVHIDAHGVAPGQLSFILKHFYVGFLILITLPQGCPE